MRRYVPPLKLTIPTEETDKDQMKYIQYLPRNLSHPKNIDEVIKEIYKPQKDFIKRQEKKENSF